MEANDNVNHPAHYTDGKIEVIDYIQDKGFNFCRGNAIKYISRAGQLFCGIDVSWKGLTKRPGTKHSSGSFDTHLM